MILLADKGIYFNACLPPPPERSKNPCVKRPYFDDNLQALRDRNPAQKNAWF
jgi:hypothetical protein